MPFPAQRMTAFMERVYTKSMIRLNDQAWESGPEIPADAENSESWGEKICASLRETMGASEEVMFYGPNGEELYYVKRVANDPELAFGIYDKKEGRSYGVTERGDISLSMLPGYEITDSIPSQSEVENDIEKIRGLKKDR